jgi:ABC-type transport system involved in multi-copper enzyme maturation permease subunit
MVIKFILKEVKDRRGLLVFTLALFLCFLLGFMVIKPQSSIVEPFAVALSIVVLPLVGLLFGASGFEAEFRSGAWAYLASRPVKRGTIWFMKYISLAIIVGVVFLLYFVLLFAFPGARTFLTGTIYEYAYASKISLFLLGLLLYLLAFHIAFSLSFLSGKQLQTVFVALFVILGLGLVLYLYFNALQFFYPYVVGMNGILAFVAASFAGASFFSFTKSDFSQPRKKSLDFVKSVTILLLISLALGTAWARLGGRTIGPGRFIWNLQTAGNGAYFTSNRGIFLYDPQKDAVRNLGGKPWLIMPLSISFGGKNLLFLNYSGWRGMTQELWTMSEDGLRKALLASARDKKSPFYRLYFFSARLSLDGTKAALLTRPKGNEYSRAFPYALRWMNMDGSDLRSAPLGEPLNPGRTIEFLSWTRSGRDLLLYQFPPPGKNLPGKLYVFNFASGTCRFLAECQEIAVPAHISPGNGHFIFVHEDAGRRRVALLDLETCDFRDIFDGEDIKPSGFRWSPDGQKIVFFSRRLPDELALNVYSLPADKIATVPVIQDPKPNPTWSVPYADWVYGGSNILIAQRRGAAWSLRLFSAELKEEKAFPVPEQVRPTGYFVAMAGKVLAESQDERGLWRCDLGTGGWKKVY